MHAVTSIMTTLTSLEIMRRRLKFDNFALTRHLKGPFTYLGDFRVN